MSTLNDLIAEKNSLTDRLATAKGLLQEILEDVTRVGGLSDILIGETDDEPGWPDLEITLGKVETWLRGEGEPSGDDDDV